MAILKYPKNSPTNEYNKDSNVTFTSLVNTTFNGPKKNHVVYLYFFEHSHENYIYVHGSLEKISGLY